MTDEKKQGPKLTPQQTSVLRITSKRHVKVWLLHELLLSNKDIATAMGTNTGHVGNVLRDYRANPDKITAAKSMMPPASE